MTDRTQPLYKRLASALQAIENCAKSGNAEWQARHDDTIKNLCRDYLPCGGGFDSGTTFNFDDSKPQRLVLQTSFHHMNEHGYYDGWTEHAVIITPCLFSEFNVDVRGRDRSGIKDHIAETFAQALRQEIPDSALA